MKRREFIRYSLAGAAMAPFAACDRYTRPEDPGDVTAASSVFSVRGVPDQALSGNRHAGVDTLVGLMAANGLKLYRTSTPGAANGADGLVASDDVVLLKVNAQWKYRGCTNSDVVRGLIQRVLEHPDGFTGEVVIVENGQGRGSLACDTSDSYGNAEVHANAEDETHSFLWLVDTLFADPRVSACLLDPVRGTFIGDGDHAADGYRRLENVSYPCFTTAGGRRVELASGVWNGAGFEGRLKVINVPVLKHHDVGGSEITGALKHMYGLVSMSDGQSGFRHYAGLGETAGKMMAKVRTPVLNIIDAIWVSQGALGGTPASATTRTNRLAASQDPVALDYWAAKNILYPVDNNERHHPDFAGIAAWLTDAKNTINGLGGFDAADQGVRVKNVTTTESEITVYEASVS